MRLLNRSKVLVILGSATVALMGPLSGPEALAATATQSLGMEPWPFAMSAVDLNNSGVVVGSQGVGTTSPKAVKWAAGVVSVLPSLPGTVNSFSTAVNDAGVIVGASIVSNQGQVPTEWTGADVTQIPLPSANSSGVAWDVNRSGQAVGTWWSPSSSTANHAFLWSQGQSQDLGTMGGVTVQRIAINDAGVIAGTLTDTLNNFRVFVRAPDGTSHVIGLPAGYTFAKDVQVNSAGQVLFLAGTSTSSQQAAFVWQNYRTTPITIPGCSLTVASADINATGQVVGTCRTAAGAWRAFLWKDGVATFLPVPPGTTSSGAGPVNDVGDIIGGVTVSGQSTAVAWHTSGRVWGDVYTTPGYWISGGHEWSTTCEAYGTTATRCTATIKATQVKLTSTGFVAVTGWVFNNLTYTDKASAAWSTNPLAVTGTFTSGGRLWSTTCTPNITTGPRTCRTYIWATVYGRTALSTGGYTYWQKNQWLFNNMVVLS